MASAAACIAPAAAEMPGADTFLACTPYRDLSCTYIALTFLFLMLTAAVSFLWKDIVQGLRYTLRIFKGKRPCPQSLHDDKGKHHFEEAEPMPTIGGEAEARVTRGHPPKALERRNSQYGKGIGFHDQACTGGEAAARVA